MAILKNSAIDFPPSWREHKGRNGLKFQQKRLKLNKNKIFLSLGIRKQKDVLG